MDKNKIRALWQLFALPALLILFGLILLIAPDTAISLVIKLLAWIFIVFGTVKVIGLLMDRTCFDLGKWLWPALALGAGGYFLVNPLVLANMVGRVIGILLVIQGINDLRKSQYGGSKILAIVTLIAGVTLFILPRTLTNTLLGLCGLVMIVVGVLNLLGKLQERKQLDGDSAPKIIDADE